MKILSRIVGAILLLLLGFFLFVTVMTYYGVTASAQIPPVLQMQTPTPQAASVNAIALGNPGQASYVYFVVVNYPAGAVISQGALVQRVSNVLSASNSVNVGWSGLPGASTYDVIRLLPTQSFTGACLSCSVATGLTVTSFVDQGGATSNYTVGSLATAGAATFYVNNRDFSTPQIRQILNGVDSGISGIVYDGHSLIFCPTCTIGNGSWTLSGGFLPQQPTFKNLRTNQNTNLFLIPNGTADGSSTVYYNCSDQSALTCATFTVGSHGTFVQLQTDLLNTGVGFDAFKIGERHAGAGVLTNICFTFSDVCKQTFTLDGSAKFDGNVQTLDGNTVLYRCTVAGTLRAGQLTSVAADCGTAVDSGLRTP